jgi:hypothetical protein
MFLKIVKSIVTRLLHSDLDDAIQQDATKLEELNLRLDKLDAELAALTEECEATTRIYKEAMGNPNLQLHENEEDK